MISLFLNCVTYSVCYLFCTEHFPGKALLVPVSVYTLESAKCGRRRTVSDVFIPVMVIVFEEHSYLFTDYIKFLGCPI